MADPNAPGARPGVPRPSGSRPLPVGQRPTSPGTAPASADPAGQAPAPAQAEAEAPPPAQAPAPGAPAPRPSGQRAGPVLSAARPSGSKATLGGSGPVPSGSRPALGASPTPTTGAGLSRPSEIQERTSGLKLKPQHADVKQALREGAIDTVLNAAGILGDVWNDFRNQDRYFKYKAGIIAGWVFLSVTSFFIAFSGGSSYFDAKNRLGAQLIEAGEPSRPVYMIRNNSEDPWNEVTVVANGRYRTAVGTVEPNGGTLTFNPRQLKGDNDTAAPPDLVITDLQLRTDDGNAWLKKDGELR